CQEELLGGLAWPRSSQQEIGRGEVTRGRAVLHATAVSPQVGGGIAFPPGSLPMSPQQPPPQRSDSGGARLNAFLNQVPAAHHFPLMHVERPSGQQPPPKAKPAPRP
ncbi:hypothetical protein PF007_g31376, partial [Phytophthora fragariae]